MCLPGQWFESFFSSRDPIEQELKIVNWERKKDKGQANLQWDNLLAEEGESKNEKKTFHHVLIPPPHRQPQNDIWHGPPIQPAPHLLQPICTPYCPTPPAATLPP